MGSNNPPLVTLVTPTYNQARYLPETLDSVLGQTYRHIEYLVINDGSSDDTEAVLRRYDGLLSWRSQSNRGQAATLNAGWQAARGKYVGYLSSDDLLHPEAVARLVSLLENDPGCVCAYPDCNVIDQHSAIIKRRVGKPFDLAELVVRQECHIGPGALFRAQALQRVGGWKPELRLAPDREFWMRLAGEGKFEFLAEPLAGYRLHSESISYRGISDELSREYLQVLDDYFEGDVPAGLLRRKKEAYGFAYLVMARNAMRRGDLRRAARYWNEARSRHKAFSHPRHVLRLFRNAISKPIHVLRGRLRAGSRRAR